MPRIIVARGAVIPAEATVIVETGDHDARQAPSSGTSRSASPRPEGRDNAYTFRGFIDFYGYRALAEGWFVAGWIAHPWPVGHRPERAVAVFADRRMIDCSLSLFYHRADLSGHGIGFVFFFPSTSPRTGMLLSTLIESAGSPQPINPPAGLTALNEQELIGRLENLVTGGELGSQRWQMRALLLGERADEAATGFIDFYGHHDAAGAWLFSGWISRTWREGQPPERIVASFDEGDIEGEACAILYQRPDVPDDAEGIAFMLRDAVSALGRLCSVSFEAGGVQATLYASSGSPQLREIDLRTRLRPLLDRAMPGPHRDVLFGLIERRSYRGEDTLASLSPGVFLEIDEAILCGADCLVLMGWCLAAPGEIHAIRLRCGSRMSSLNFDDCIRLDRPDVIEAFGQHGFSEPRCGFIAFLPHSVRSGSHIHIEIETTRGEVGYRTVPPPRLEGIDAMRRLLSVVDVRFAEVQPAFDLVIGPAVERLNQARLATPTRLDITEYGRVQANPRFSVIVPLYGRLDFVEYQLALFSAHPPFADIELIYVLDDPPKRRAAQFLFASVFERFRIPFKAVLLDRNVGFAPANNIGLRHARGTFIAYLNSDVFPGTLDWLEQLSDRLVADPSIGMVGPVLLYEDGSLQHHGIFFRRLPEFGGWHFADHHDKALRPSGDGGLETHASITGACMVMTRTLALEMGGFDETFVVGDFEDTDLCLRLQARGYRCVVDPRVRLFHLERKSQASSGLGWRMNLTLYNAWQHERRWGQKLAAPPEY